MKPRVKVTVRLAAAAGLVMLGLWPASPGSAEDSIKVGSLAEAWYEKAEVADDAPAPPEVPDPCTLPIGCLPLPVPVPEVPEPASIVYPAGTLHIEATAGKRSALAFIVPDFASLPFDATILSGELVLPINKDPQSLNSNVETAKLRACVTTETVKDGDTGKPYGAPKFDCKLATSDARYDKDAGSFSVDLGPFISAWQAGTPNFGVAILPAADLGPEANFHVAVNGKDVAKGKSAASFLKIELAETPDIPDAPTVPPAIPDVGGGSFTPPASTSGPLETPPVTPPVTAPEAAPPSATEPAPYALLNSPWYTYRGVIFLPLAFLVAVGFSGRSLTRPLGMLAGR